MHKTKALWFNLFNNKVDIRVFWSFFEQITIYLSQSIRISAMHTANYIISLSISTRDQKQHTKSLLSFCLWLDGNSSFKSHLDIKSKERLCNQRVSESKYRKTKAVDKDILITYRFSDRKFPQPFITTSGLLQEQGTWNNSASSPFHELLTNVVWIKSLNKAVNWIEILMVKVFYVFLDHIILFDSFCWQ